MTTEQAILAIDGQVAWMAQRRLINENTRKRMVASLETIVASVANIAGEAETNAMAEAFSKLKSILKMMGMTTKGMEKALELPADFLERYSETAKETGFFIDSESAFYAMLQQYRIFCKLAAGDVATVKEYRFFRKMDSTTRFLRQMYPHLSDWFDKIDNDGAFGQKKVYDEAYQNSLKPVTSNQ